MKSALRWAAVDGHDDFADWPSPFREQRGGRDDRRPADQYAYDFDGDSRVPAPRSGDSRYSSLADLSAGPGPGGGRDERDWDRGGDRYQAPPDPDFVPRGQRSGQPMPTADQDFAPRGSRSGAPLPPPDADFAPRGPRQAEPMPDIDFAPRSPRERGPVSPPALAGPPMGHQDPIQQPTSTVDAAAVRRSVAESDGLYRSKRPALLVAFWALAGLGELLMVRPLLAGMFKTEAGLALAPLLAMTAFPFLALGLYALTTGAATAVQFQGPRVWLRTPLAYLLVGAALMLAAATAS
ncbi:hypothetical protein GCM10009661_48250 [Catellatospora chokoriensis]|uniref:Uncharacterized protein n=1 Tax=Catellatospora chokoriensis TaxID=310353 RepID=A0A8J3K2U5_9ACTN|nr:hypothetical protein Cch02nite_48460 [Catellatospora chokoriensis]